MLTYNHKAHGQGSAKVIGGLGLRSKSSVHSGSIVLLFIIFLLNTTRRLCKSGSHHPQPSKPSTQSPKSVIPLSTKRQLFSTSSLLETPCLRRIGVPFLEGLVSP